MNKLPKDNAILSPVAKVAQDIAFLVKYNEYPTVHSEGFQQLTTLFNKLEIELTKAGMGIGRGGGV